MHESVLSYCQSAEKPVQVVLRLLTAKKDLFGWIVVIGMKFLFRDLNQREKLSEIKLPLTYKDTDCYGQ